MVMAQSVIVTETQTWKSVPVTVDTGAKTYVVTGTVPTGTTEYYYTYPGYRCFAERREVGVDALIFNANVSGGATIYCYPE